MDKPKEYIINIPDDAPLPYSQYKEHNGDVCNGYMHCDTGTLMVLITDMLEPKTDKDGKFPQIVLFPFGYLKLYYSPLQSWMFGNTRG